MPFEKLKGFREFYPDDMQVREDVFQIMKETCRIFGFSQIDYPSLENVEMYIEKSGEEIVKQLYSFVDKGGREVTLIPEATPTTVRMASSRKDLRKPIKWFSLPKLWRYEEPQSGRTREHVQLNVDIFGDPSPGADAQVIDLAAEILSRLGLKNRFEIRINHRKVMENIILSFGDLDVKEILAITDRFHKESRDDFALKLRKSGMKDEEISTYIEFLSRKVKGSEFNQLMDEFFSNKIPKNELSNLSEVLEILDSLNIKDVYFDPSTVRGLSYYTGTVFEGFDKEGSFRSIFGGGRYDNLASLIGGSSLEAVGFGMGDAVIENLMKKFDLWKSTKKDKFVYVALNGMENLAYATDVIRFLRERRIKVEYNTKNRSISASLREASILGCDYAIIIGKKEKDNESITVKDLADGSQVVMKKNEIHNSDFFK
ncbi:histidine--tRNA ligase [Caldiplasma sukawensis]